jgi:hypothetical protein
MSRYATTNTITDSFLKSRRATTIISDIPLLSTDIYIRTTSIERLDKLANKFYGNSTLWWIIASANALGKGTIVVPTNTIIRIPAPASVTQIINSINEPR